MSEVKHVKALLEIKQGEVTVLVNGKPLNKFFLLNTGDVLVDLTPKTWDNVGWGLARPVLNSVAKNIEFGGDHDEDEQADKTEAVNEEVKKERQVAGLTQDFPNREHEKALQDVNPPPEKDEVQEGVNPNTGE